LLILLFALFQIVRRFGFSRYIAFIMYLDIVYIKAMYLEKPKRLAIWNGGSSFQFCFLCGENTREYGGVAHRCAAGQPGLESWVSLKGPLTRPELGQVFCFLYGYYFDVFSSIILPVYVMLFFFLDHIE